MQRPTRKLNAPDHDDHRQQGHTATPPRDADAGVPHVTGILGKPGSAQGTSHVHEAVAGRPGSPDAPSQQGASQISDICLPTSSFDLPRFDVGQQGQAEGDTCWPIPHITQASHSGLPPRAGSLPPRMSNESNASCGHGNLMRGDVHGATSRPHHGADTEYLSRTANMHVRHYASGYLLQPQQPQELPYAPTSMPCQPFNDMGVMSGAGQDDTHHAAPIDTGDEHWPENKPLIWDRQPQEGVDPAELDDVEHMLACMPAYNADVNWPHDGQYMLADSGQQLSDLQDGHATQATFREGYMSVSSDAPGGSDAVPRHTKLGSIATVSGSSAGVSHASVLPTSLPTDTALPPLIISGESPCSLDVGNTTPTTMVPTSDGVFMQGVYDVLPDRSMPGALECMMVPQADGTAGSGGGGSGATMMDMQVACNSMDANKFNMARLQGPIPSNPPPPSPMSAPSHAAAIIKTCPPSQPPCSKRQRDGEPFPAAKAGPAVDGVSTGLGARHTRAIGGMKVEERLYPTAPAHKGLISTSDPLPMIMPSPNSNKLLQGTPRGAPSCAKPPPVSAFSMPSIKIEPAADSDSIAKRSKLVSSNMAAEVVGPTGVGKSAASALLATIKPMDAFSPLLANLKGRNNPITGDTKALLNTLLAPTPMDMAPRKSRRGGGRTSQGDPRLVDPDIDDKKARRIVANRLSAARSKMRQRQLAEQVEQEHAALEQHKAQLALTITDLTAKVGNLESENDALRQRVVQLEAERSAAHANRGGVGNPAMPSGVSAGDAGMQQPRPVSKFSIGDTHAAAALGLNCRWHPSSLPSTGNTGCAKPLAGPQAGFTPSSVADSMPSMTTLAGASQQGPASSLPPGLLSNMGALPRQREGLLPSQATVLRSGSGLPVDAAHTIMHAGTAYGDHAMLGARHNLKLHATTSLPCPPSTMPALNLQDSAYVAAAAQQPARHGMHGMMVGPDPSSLQDWAGMQPGSGHRMPPGSRPYIKPDVGSPQAFPSAHAMLHQQVWGMKKGGAMGRDPRVCALAMDDTMAHMAGDSMGSARTGSVHQQ